MKHHPLVIQYLAAKANVKKLENAEQVTPDALEDAYELYFEACENLATPALKIAVENGLPKDALDEIKDWELLSEDNQQRIFHQFIILMND